MTKKFKQIKFHPTYFIIIIAIIIVIIGSYYAINQPNDQNIPEKTKYIIHPSELKSGGLPKGGIGFDVGIPAIADPKFETVEQATWMNDDDLILGLNYKGIIKAYPNRILILHEIVNDLIENESIIITYCPLCMSGLAFKSSINGENLRFGVSGKLMNSNLVMYDEKTDSYWNQLTGQAIIGELAGITLERIPIIPTTWGDWKQKYPETLVLSQDTGFSRNYNQNPYTEYFKSSDTFGTQFDDNRLNAKDIVFPVEINGEVKVYAEKYVRNDKLINDIVGGEKILVVWDSELKTVRIFKNSDSEKLQEFQSFNTYWFSWVAFKPDSIVYKSE